MDQESRALISSKAWNESIWARPGFGARNRIERARGEQASLRALANAARLMKDNPALANLRFLQTLEQAPGAKTIVLGGNAVPLADFGGTKV